MTPTLIEQIRATKWVGHKGLFGRNDRWTHPLIVGLSVRHCGHPTALRPYYVAFGTGSVVPIPEERDHTLHRCFPRLRDAQEAVIESLAEEIAAAPTAHSQPATP